MNIHTNCICIICTIGDTQFYERILWIVDTELTVKISVFKNDKSVASTKYHKFVNF